MRRHATSPTRNLTAGSTRGGIFASPPARSRGPSLSPGRSTTAAAAASGSQLTSPRINAWDRLGTPGNKHGKDDMSAKTAPRAAAVPAAMRAAAAAVLGGSCRQGSPPASRGAQSAAKGTSSFASGTGRFGESMGREVGSSGTKYLAQPPLAMKSPRRASSTEVPAAGGRSTWSPGNPAGGQDTAPAPASVETWAGVSPGGRTLGARRTSPTRVSTGITPGKSGVADIGSSSGTSHKSPSGYYLDLQQQLQEDLQVLEDQITSIDEEGEEEAVAAAAAAALASEGAVAILHGARAPVGTHSTTTAAAGLQSMAGSKNKGHFRRCGKPGVAAGMDIRPGTAPVPGARGMPAVGATLRRRQGGVASEDIGRLMALPSSLDWAGDYGDLDPCISHEQQKTIHEQQKVIAGGLDEHAFCHSCFS